jgi:ribosomal protein S18 acetylase RimI-like enzyme
MTAENLELRRFRPADAEEVWKIHEEALRASGLAFIEDAADEDFTKIPEQYLESGGEFLVGSVHGRLIAMGGLQPVTEARVELRRMRVHPEFQGQGYGARVLSELEVRAHQLGFTEIVLYTNSKLTAARQMYDNYGYEETRRERDSETGETFIHYRKKVDSR